MHIRKTALINVLICCLLLTTFSTLVISAKELTCNYVSISGDVGDKLRVEFFDGTNILTNWTLDSEYATKSGDANLVLQKAGVGSLEFKVANQKIKLPFSIRGDTNTTKTSSSNSIADSFDSSAKTQKNQESSKQTSPPKEETKKSTSINNATVTNTKVEIKPSTSTSTKPTQEEIKTNVSEKEQGSTQKNNIAYGNSKIYIETSDSRTPNLIMRVGKSNIIKCIDGQIDVSTNPSLYASDGSYNLYIQKTVNNKNYLYKIGSIQIKDREVNALKGNSSEDVSCNKKLNTFFINANTNELGGE